MVSNWKTCKTNPSGNSSAPSQLFPHVLDKHYLSFPQHSLHKSNPQSLVSRKNTSQKFLEKKKSLLSRSIVLPRFLYLSHLQAICMKKIFVSKAWLTKAHLFPNTTEPWCCLQQGSQRLGWVSSSSGRCYRVSHRLPALPVPREGNASHPPLREECGVCQLRPKSWL